MKIKQKRIVLNENQIFALCGALESRIKEMQSIVENVNNEEMIVIALAEIETLQSIVNENNLF